MHTAAKAVDVHLNPMLFTSNPLTAGAIKEKNLNTRILFIYIYI